GISIGGSGCSCRARTRRRSALLPSPLQPHPSMVHQRQELIPRLLPLPESPQHRARHRPRVLLLHSPHHHAEVPRFADHSHSHRIDDLLDGLRHFLRQPLLYLQPPRKGVHNPRNLAQPDHFRLGQVRYVHLAEERQHVVLAHAEELDVPHNHHLVVFHVVQRAVYQLADVHLVAARQEFEGLVHAFRGFLQAFALRIFHQHRQHFLHQRSHVRLLLPRMNHFHDRFIRFHGPSLKRLLVQTALTSKMFRAVSAMRTRSSFGHSPGNAPLQFSFNLRQISTARFSDVGTTRSKESTSAFRLRCPNGSSTCRFTNSSNRSASTA